MKGIYLINEPVVLHNGKPENAELHRNQQAGKGSIAWKILSSHNRANEGEDLHLRFDALVSHDITYVGIIQTARASGMTSFPVPYALTNCHNSLCAVGGTINEDDHVFGLSAAKKYGGIYVPANQSVIHSFAREMLAGCGKMILGSDSHTRYGAIGTMGIGEGGPELVKQLLCRTYDIKAPKTVLVYLTGKPKPGIGPHDVAIALVGAVFSSGFVRNCVLEFAGPGVASLPMDFRCGVDVMTTETGCLSSVWETDDATCAYLSAHGRAQDYRRLLPDEGAYYDRMVSIHLDEIESMIALPFHPSNAYTIHEFLENATALLRNVEEEAAEKFKGKRPALCAKVQPDGSVLADQGIIAGCAGGMFDSVAEAEAILRGGDIGNSYFSMSVYPASVPESIALTRAGVTEKLLEKGVVIKPSFCGPCFGAGDVPANNGLSLRHTTRNFPNREGSKPGEGQLATVALMDACSIAATARNGGKITAATDIAYDYTPIAHEFDRSSYEKRVYFGYGHPQKETELIFGPNITPWPEQYPLGDHILLRLCAVIHDAVTTTDELIPSGETSSYRSNPLRLAEFTLSRREPSYVGAVKAVHAEEEARRNGQATDTLRTALSALGEDPDRLLPATQIGSCLFAEKPGDGSAREQAASCQRVLGGLANICYEFATKRYRSNCINWGILPFTLDADVPFPYAQGDWIFVPEVRNRLLRHETEFPARVVRADGTVDSILLHINGLTQEDTEILTDGCLMNYYRTHTEDGGTCE